MSEEEGETIGIEEKIPNDNIQITNNSQISMFEKKMKKFLNNGRRLWEEGTRER